MCSYVSGFECFLQPLTGKKACLVGSHRNVFPARTRASSSSLYSRKIVDDMFAETNIILHYYIGTMIEIPRAALVVDEVMIKVLFLMDRINEVDKIE
jgi:hypothetical protein